MRAIAFIESNFTGIDAIRRAAEDGIKCYLVSSNVQQLKAMLPFELFEGLSEIAEIVLVENSDSADDVIAAIKNLPLPVEAVMTFSQFRLLTTTRVARALGLRCTSEESLSFALDKYKLRQAMERAGAPSIRFMKLTESTTAADIHSKVGLPCIFKPARGHSSLGVTLVKREIELRAVRQRTRRSYY